MKIIEAVKLVAFKQPFAVTANRLILAALALVFHWMVLLPTVQAQSLHGLAENDKRLPNVATAMDSTRLNAALDSLRKQELSPSALAHKTDSLRKAFSKLHPPAIEEKLKQMPLPLQMSPDLSSPAQHLLTEEASEVIKKLPEGTLPVELPSSANLAGIPGLAPAAVNASNLGAGILKKLPQQSVPIFSPEEIASFNRAKEFFAAHRKELGEAQRKLSRYNGRLNRIESLKDLPKSYWLFNPLKDRLWSERLIIGTLWQFSNQKQYHIDMSPNLAWCLTDLFSLGAGFQYRLSISAKNSPWINSSDKVYGYYSFLDVQIKKGIFGRIQYEELITMVPRYSQINKSETLTQQWVKGLSLGIGKTYSFYKRINGYSLVQYNLMHKDGETPFLRPLQIKVGFYINGNHVKLSGKTSGNSD